MFLSDLVADETSVALQRPLCITDKTSKAVQRSGGPSGPLVAACRLLISGIVSSIPLMTPVFFVCFFSLHLTNTVKYSFKLSLFAEQ